MRPQASNTLTRSQVKQKAATPYSNLEPAHSASIHQLRLEEDTILQTDESGPDRTGLDITQGSIEQK